MNYPKRVKIVELESAPFQCAKDAIVYAKSHGIDGKHRKGNAVNDRVTIAVPYGCVSIVWWTKRRISPICNANSTRRIWRHGRKGCLERKFKVIGSKLNMVVNGQIRKTSNE